MDYTALHSSSEGFENIDEILFGSLEEENEKDVFEDMFNEDSVHQHDFTGFNFCPPISSTWRGALIDRHLQEVNAAPEAIPMEITPTEPAIQEVENMEVSDNFGELGAYEVPEVPHESTMETTPPQPQAVPEVEPPR